MNSSLSRSSIIILLVLCVVILGALAGFYFYTTQSRSPGFRDLRPYIPQKLAAAKLAGDEQTEVNEYRAIIADPTANIETKAIATVNITSAEFRLSGDVNTLVEYAQQLKKVAVDTAVSIRTRATAVTVLEILYNDSGRDPKVFAAIYQGTPWSNYLVPGDPDLSAIKLGELSYGMRHASSPAIYTAYLYAAQYFLHPNQSAATTAADASFAEDYMKKANAALPNEMKLDPNFRTSDRYLVYRQWRAVVIGFLAVEKGEPYKSQYQKEYEDFFTFVQSSKLGGAQDQYLFGLWQYARILAKFGNTSEETTQLALLAKNLNAVAKPDGSAFAQFLKNEHGLRPTDTPWTTTQAMMTVSPEFKAAVEKVIATTPTP